MDRETLSKKLQAMKAKAKKARKDGKKAAVKMFKSASKRLGRKLRGLPKPLPTKKQEATS